MSFKFEGSESAWNFGAEYLKAVKFSLDMCKNYAITRDAHNWCHWLRAYYRELSLMTKEEEDIMIEERFKDIYNHLNSLNDDPEKVSYNHILYLLDSLEITLRKIMQKKGMALPKGNDPKYAVLQR